MAQPPRDHAFVKTTKPKAAAAVSLCAGLGRRKRAELLALMRPSFARVEPWLQARKYVGAVSSGLPKRNGWSIAQHVGDRTPDRTQLPVRLPWAPLAWLMIKRSSEAPGHISESSDTVRPKMPGSLARCRPEHGTGVACPMAWCALTVETV
jgi:hypothetical protein